MKDRFSEAERELTEKNPYICESCEVAFGHPTVVAIGDEPGTTRGYAVNAQGADCILNCDPMPFGD
jgi:hypothetical protein